MSLALSLIVFFLIQAVLIGIEMRKLTEDGVVSRLQDDMEGIVAAFSAEPDKAITVDWEHIPSIFIRPFSSHYFQVSYKDKVIRSRSLWDHALDIQKPGIYRAVEGPVNQKLLILARLYVVHGQEILLSVAENTSELEATSLYFQKRMLILSFIVLLVLLMIQVWVIRYSLKPLVGLKKELQDLERGEIGRLKQSVPSEITPLVEEVNHLLEVLQQRLVRSRHAMGNLSHALKTPLTLMFQILERRQNDSDCTRLLEQAKRIELHMNRELSRAKTAGQSPAGIWPQPKEDMRDLIDALEAVHCQRVHIALELGHIEKIYAEREDMMELAGNLIDNACKWAKGHIQVKMYHQSGLMIEIEDDGPGMTTEESLQVLARGVRMDETKQGHGLGLAIVREIVDSYGGELELKKSARLGGLSVWVCLPQASVKGIY
ncbi:MAG: ATP-binding protein [Mariprofundus sp.]